MSSNSLTVVDNISRPHRIAAILAGGSSRRMGAIDKATFEFQGRRLVDHVIDRVAPQADEIVLSAKRDYGTKLDIVPDQQGKLAGPVAGLWAISSWIEVHRPLTTGFFTVPVDAPLTPPDFFERLNENAGSAIAATGSGLHPTFGYWEVKSLLATLAEVPAGSTISLQAAARNIGGAAS